jgi:hypothetical protein
MTTSPPQTQDSDLLDTRGPRHRRSGGGPGEAIRNNLFPFLVFVAINAAFLLSVGLLSPERRRTFAETHGDSSIYLWIANSGYTLTRCSGPPFPKGSWCGNTAWQPLYPWMIKVVSLVGISQTAAAEILTQVFALGVLVLVWQFARRSRHAHLIVVLAAVFPGAVYLYTIYPVSLVIFLSLLLFKLLEQRRYAWAMVPAFLIPLGYSSAGAIIGVVGLWWLVFRRLDEWKKGALVVGASVAGYLTFLAVMRITVGNWRAEFLSSAKYGIGLHNPASTLVTLVTTEGRGTSSLLQTNQTLITPLQTALVLAMLGLMTYVVWKHRRALSVSDQLIACYGYVFWLVPLFIGLGVSAYRTNALLVPIAILFRYLPRPLIIALIVLAAPLAYFLAIGVLAGPLL